MFGRKRKTTRTVDVLTAIVVHRPVLSGLTTPERLVHALRVSLEHVHTAVADRGGTVLRFIGNVTVAAWVCDPGGASDDPVGIARRLVAAARVAAGEARRSNAPLLGPVLVGLVRSPCVVEEQGGRVLSAMGYAVLRAYDFPAVARGREGDVIAIDSSLRNVLSPGAWRDDGDGVCVVPVEPA